MKLQRLFPDPFVGALLGTILLAFLWPAAGTFASAVDLAATGAVTLLFFLHGVRTPRDAIVSGVTNWRVHLAIVACTFAIFPALGLTLSNLARPLLPAELWLGVLFLCVVPSTVQSSIAFTSIARGNVSVAIAAATFSNLLGVMITPLLVIAIMQSQGAGIPLSGVWSIVTQLLLPFVLGQFARPLLGQWAVRRKKLLSLTDRFTIALAVYSAFSAAVLGGLFNSLELATFLTLCGTCVALLAAMLLIARLGSRALRFSPQDEAATVFCGSMKTLASGVPMARVLFAGPELGAVLLPLMIFHQLQLMVCAWVAQQYARSADLDTCAIRVKAEEYVR